MQRVRNNWNNIALTHRHMVIVGNFTWFPQDEVRETLKTRVVGSGKLFTGVRDIQFRDRDRKTPVSLGWKAT